MGIPEVGRGHCIGEHAQSSMIVCLCCATILERERKRRSDSSRQLLNTQTKVKQKLHLKLPNTTWYFLYTVINDLPSDKACNTLCVRLRAFGLKKALGVILFNLWGVLQKIFSDTLKTD